jgi:hypothetical protein
VSLLGDLKKYRVPVLIGAAGVVGLSAYQRSKSAAQDAAAAAIPAAGGGASIEGGSLSAQEALGVQSAAFQAGGGLGLQGAALGLQTAERGLDLAGLAITGAQLVSGDVVGLAATLGNRLGDVAGQAVSVLPSFAPYEGIQPQPTQPVYTTQPVTQPTPTPTPTPAPAPAAPTVVSRTAEYVVHTGTGTIRLYTVSGSGALTNQRTTTWAKSSSAPVARVVSGGVLHWRTTAGGYTGWSYIPGKSGGSWSVTRQYREKLSDGTTRLTSSVNIGQSGS